MPSMEKQYEVFPVNGITIDVSDIKTQQNISVLLQISESRFDTVELSSISFQSAGVYRCEVSNEFPDFDTVSKAEILSVVGRHANKT